MLCLQEDHHEAIQRELGVEFAKDDEEDEEEHAGAPIGLPYQLQAFGKTSFAHCCANDL